MNGAFSTHILSEKLNKLNTSQQSIETLSHWCIFHRRKAKQVVRTWETEFFRSTKERRVSFLYLANDILQNSRRKGTEFVNEFWKVLHGALKAVLETGDENGRNTVYRLVDIWEERKVFGSRPQSLREEIIGKDAPPDLDHYDKPSHSIKIKRDGSILERVAKSFKTVNDSLGEEEATLEECATVRRSIENLEKEASNRGATNGRNVSAIAEDLQQQQGWLSQCIEQLEASELARSNLVNHLREALHEQEMKLEQIRTHLQIAHAQAEQAVSIRKMLNGSPRLGDRMSSLDAVRSSSHRNTQSGAENGSLQQASSVVGPVSTATTLVETMAPVDLESKKHAAAAAEVAAKLAASTSSAQMLTSVLSSLAAEEVAASLGLHSTPSDVNHSQEKRQRIESSVEMMPHGDFQHQAQLQHQAAPIQPPPSMHHSVQPLHHQASPVQPQPPPPMPQFMGAIMGVPYGYSASTPPPPMQVRPMLGMLRMAMPPQPPQPPQPPPLQPLPPGCAPGPYQGLQPPALSYYAQPPIPAPAPPGPIPR